MVTLYVSMTNETKRIFIAFDTPKQLQRALKGSYDKSIDVRWTAPENLHVTLVFLGNMTKQQIDLLKDYVSVVAQKHRPIAVKISGIIKIREMIWAEVESSQELSCLYDDLQEILSVKGLLKTGHSKYKPHINLGRFQKKDSNKVRWEGPSAALESYMADHMVIFESILLPNGPRYISINAYPLPYG